MSPLPAPPIPVVQLEVKIKGDEGVDDIRDVEDVSGGGGGGGNSWKKMNFTQYSLRVINMPNFKMTNQAL